MTSIGFDKCLCALIPPQVTKFATNVSNLINNSGMYFVYASLSLCCAIFTALIVPETKGKSPEEMKDYFTPHKNKEELPKNSR